MNANDIVERLRSVAWGHRHTNADVARFLEGFSDAPYRSEQTRSLVGGLCPHAPRWYSTASVEGLLTESHDKYSLVGEASYTRSRSPDISLASSRPHTTGIPRMYIRVHWRRWSPSVTNQDFDRCSGCEASAFQKLSTAFGGSNPIPPPPLPPS